MYVLHRLPASVKNNIQIISQNLTFIN